jgi:hypothetical protein
MGAASQGVKRRYTQAMKLVFIYVEGLPQRTASFVNSAESLDQGVVLDKLARMFAPHEADIMSASSTPDQSRQ